MRLATKFKSAVVGIGITLSALGTAGMTAELKREAALKSQDSAGDYVNPTIRAQLELDKANDTVVFLTGTTLIAAGLRRRKTAP